MEAFEFSGKTKVKRVFEAVRESFDRNKCVRVVGRGDGTIKAVAVAEKLKSSFGNVDQVNEILVFEEQEEKKGEIGLGINLRLV